MPTYIKDDYRPSKMVYDSARKEGAIPEFVEYVFEDFMIYWKDLRDRGLAKGKKQSWDSTFRVWVVRAYRGRVGTEWENRRHRYQERSGGLKDGLFHANLFGEEPETPKRPMVRNVTKEQMQSFEPEPGDPIASEDAFEEMRKILKI